MTPLPSVSLDDLQWLASAVAGRDLQIGLAGDDALHAFCDGRTVRVPANALGRDASSLCVVAQALLVAAGSLQAAVLRRLLGRPLAARRYACLEVMRAVAGRDRPVPQHFIDQLPAALPFSLPGDAQGSASLALSAQAMPAVPDFMGTVRPGVVLSNAIDNGGWSQWLKRSGANPEAPPAAPVRELGDDEASEESTLLRLFSNPFGGNNMAANLLNQLLGAGAQRGQQQLADGGEGAEEAPVGRMQRAWRRGVMAVRARLDQDPGDDREFGDPVGHAYPEWDVHANRYRPAWTHVAEVDAWRPDGPRKVDRLREPPSSRLKRELGRLSRDHAMQSGEREGAEFDLGRLLDHAVDLRTAGAAEAPAIYRASRRTRRDLGVAVLMDASASTGDSNERGETAFDHLARTAHRLARALDTLGDRVALFGYQSWGRQRVHLVRLKGPDEPWSGRIAERVENTEPVGFTRTGAAIRHADLLLRERIRLPHRLLLLVTDGLPYDHDYQDSHADEDTRRALAEARAHGTACVCVCVGSSVDTARLSRIFGEAQLLMVDDTHDIDARIGRICAQALAQVSRRRLRHDKR